MQRLEQLRSKYSYDIIGSLPLAVLLLVTEYLEPWDIVRSQRVRIDIAHFIDSKIKTSLLWPDKGTLGIEAMAVSSFVRRSYQASSALNTCVPGTGNGGRKGGGLHFPMETELGDCSPVQENLYPMVGR